MANYEDRYHENASGPFYVDSECIACDTCTAIAPNHFKLAENYDHAYISVQPTSKQDVAFCNEALSVCPVDAIGSHF
ncbi:MAG: ferredoxin [Candidatus Marinamargulisbacteria bacterium]|jgi:ferredoxin